MFCVYTRSRYQVSVYRTTGPLGTIYVCKKIIQVFFFLHQQYMRAISSLNHANTVMLSRPPLKPSKTGVYMGINFYFHVFAQDIDCGYLLEPIASYDQVGLNSQHPQ